MMNRQISDLITNVKVSDIVEALTKNKEEHLREYREAYLAYTQALGAFFSEALKDIHAGNFEREDGYRHNLQLPQLREKEYDKLIQMFERSDQSHVELSAEQQACIFDDEWDWVIGAKSINRSYLTGAMFQ